VCGSVSINNESVFQNFSLPTMKQFFFLSYSPCCPVGYLVDPWPAIWLHEVKEKSKCLTTCKIRRKKFKRLSFF
jgi:hypothetical protein